MPKNPDFSYINPNGKRVSGSAAFNHYVYTEKGSIQKYNDEVGAAYVMEFIRKHSDIINEGLSKKIKRSRFKVV